MTTIAIMPAKGTADEQAQELKLFVNGSSRDWKPRKEIPEWVGILIDGRVCVVAPYIGKHPVKDGRERYYIDTDKIKICGQSWTNMAGPTFSIVDYDVVKNEVRRKYDD